MALLKNVPQLFVVRIGVVRAGTILLKTVELRVSDICVEFSVGLDTEFVSTGRLNFYNTQ